MNTVRKLPVLAAALAAAPSGLAAWSSAQA